MNLDIIERFSIANRRALEIASVMMACVRSGDTIPQDLYEEAQATNSEMIAILLEGRSNEPL
jgi:hypothetical protein